MNVQNKMSAPAITLTPEAGSFEAIQRMQKQKIHHIPVVDEEGKLIGIVAERDLLLSMTQHGLVDVELSEVMNERVMAVTPNTPLTEAAKIILKHHIGALPVVNKERNVVGIITETDLLQEFVNLVETLAEIRYA